MANKGTDRIAYEAARLLASGRFDSISGAIASAAERLGASEGLPRSGRVRQHLQAMSMQALGIDGYLRAVRSIFEAAEELMTLLEEGLPGCRPLLAGRAAKGHVDGGVTLHIRLYTEQKVEAIASILVEHGYAEPSFETADTRVGRLGRIVLEEKTIPIVLTRCPPALHAQASLDLFTGRPIETATVEDLRKRLITSAM